MSDEGFLYSIHLNGRDALGSDVPACPLIYSATRQDGSPCKTFSFYANQPNNIDSINRLQWLYVSLINCEAAYSASSALDVHAVKKKRNAVKGKLSKENKPVGLVFGE